MNRILPHLFLGVVCTCTALVSGCASSAAGVASNIALGVMGVKNNAASPPQKNISLQIHAANNLNADSQGKGISVVMRVYKLKDATAFGQATTDTLNDAAIAKNLFGADIIESKEQLLLPGQRYQFNEKVDAKNGYLAIAILFRNPNLQRWKLDMANAELKEDTPVIIGAHACAINVTSGLVERNSLDSKYLLSIAPCKS